MKLAINDSKTLKSLQEDFAKMFPYLKLEFFTKSHESGTGSDKRLLLDKSFKIGDCRKTHESGELFIVPHMTVSSLEQTFQMVFGLSTQVFRKSGKIWLETINTDHWTLAEHNKLGEYTVRGKPDMAEFE